MEEIFENGRVGRVGLRADCAERYGSVALLISQRPIGVSHDPPDGGVDPWIVVGFELPVSLLTVELLSSMRVIIWHASFGVSAEAGTVSAISAAALIRVESFIVRTLISSTFTTSGECVRSAQSTGAKFLAQFAAIQAMRGGVAGDAEGLGLGSGGGSAQGAASGGRAC